MLGQVRRTSAGSLRVREWGRGLDTGWPGYASSGQTTLETAACEVRYKTMAPGRAAE